MAITGKKMGGKRKSNRKNGRRYYGGAAPQIQVPQPPPGSIPSGTGGATQANYTSITNLAATQQQQAVYDKTINGGPALVTAVQTQNNKMYQLGGKRQTKKYKKIQKQKQKAGGGSKWGCLSGGKYTNRRKYISRRKYKK